MSATRHLRDPRRGIAVRALLALPALLLGSLVAGCADTPPGEAVPALAERLERVDEAVEAGNHRRVRNAVDALVTETARAEDAGEISSDQAARINAAARALLAQLPTEAPPQEPSASPASPASSGTPEPVDPPDDGDDKDPKDDDDEDDEDEDDEDEDDKDDTDEKGKGKGNGKNKD